MPNAPRLHSSTWLGFAAAAGLWAGAAPAMAQATAQELTVTGRYGADPNVQTLSAAVSYADLDLTTEAGRQMLGERVKLTARDLCKQLGEDPASVTPPAPSCQQAALDSVREQQRMAIAQATPRTMAAAPAPTETASMASEPAPAAETYGQAASVTVQTVTNGPVPDTAENRQRYGGPMSAGGRRTEPRGN